MLQDKIDTGPEGDIILMGNLNAHVGTDRTGLWNVLGAFGVGDGNGDGESLTDFDMKGLS